MAQRGFDLGSFAWRWLAAMILVFGTFNPTPYSYANWVLRDSGDWPLKALAGIAMIILYVIYVRATWRSIGPIGVGLVAAFFAAVLWVLIDYRLLDPNDPNALTYVILVVTATIMAIGLSWSHIRRRLSGQADIDDVDE